MRTSRNKLTAIGVIGARQTFVGEDVIVACLHALNDLIWRHCLQSNSVAVVVARSADRTTATSILRLAKSCCVACIPGRRGRYPFSPFSPTKKQAHIIANSDCTLHQPIIHLSSEAASALIAFNYCHLPSSPTSAMMSPTSSSIDNFISRLHSDASRFICLQSDKSRATGAARAICVVCVGRRRRKSTEIAFTFVRDIPPNASTESRDRLPALTLCLATDNHVASLPRRPPKPSHRSARTKRGDGLAPRASRRSPNPTKTKTNEHRLLSQWR